MTTATGVVREFAPADYERYVEIGNLAQPDYGWTVEEARHQLHFEEGSRPGT